MTPRVLVLSPWGLAGGYSGPVTLMNRLFAALTRTTEVDVDVAYVDRGSEEKADWWSRSFAVCSAAGGRMGFATQILWSWRAYRHLRRNSSDYDLIHVHGCYLFNLLPLLGVRGVAVAVFPVLENGDLRVTGSRPVAWVKRKLTRRALQRVTVGFALSNGIGDELHTLGVTRDRIVSLGNAVSMAEFGWPTRTRQLTRPVRLGFVGKLGATKQPHLVIQAMTLLAKQGISTSGTFVGPFVDEKYRLFFEEEASHLPASLVTVTGFTATPALYVKEAMDLFILPSAAEGMPGALAEAMVSGLPCVVTDCGAMGDTVREAECGVVVAADPSAIAAAVVDLLGVAGRWESLSEAAAAYGREHFSDSAVADTYRHYTFPALTARAAVT